MSAEPIRPAGGPLAGVRVVELAGIGPAPLAGMLLADLGADVVVVERPGRGQVRDLVPPALRIADRGKRRVELDLKSPAGRDDLTALVSRAHVLIEAFRPGTMERLGLGPDVVLARHPALVYTRVTGWGQTGPRARTAGHDITYLALTGALHAFGRPEGPPVPPANLVADFAGGTMFAALGTLAALFEAGRSGRGQVVDVAMIDGVAALLAPLLSLYAAGAWREQRGVNLFDGGAPFYDVYATADGRWVAVGALEDEFFAALVEGLGLDPGWRVWRADRARWPELRREIAAAIGRFDRDELDRRFRDTDACVAPVLSFSELAGEPHHVARESFPLLDGVRQPAAAPRLERTPGLEPTAPPQVLTPVAEVRRDWERTPPR